MSFLYIGTFGSFIGYSFAFGLVLQNQFGRTPLQAAGITFLGPLVGSLIRPVGGRLADRLGGAKVTLWNFLAMAVSVVVIVGASEMKSLPAFTVGFLALFFFSGLGNGSTYKMIPAIFRAKALTREESGDQLLWARRMSGAVIGIAGAVGALGGLFINLAFRQSFLTAKSGMPAFVAFLAFYLISASPSPISRTSGSPRPQRPRSHSSPKSDQTESSPRSNCYGGSSVRGGGGKITPPPFLTYIARGGLRQDPGRAAESSIEATASGGFSRNALSDRSVVP